MGALHSAANHVTTPNSKHIDIRRHFIRERVARKQLRIVHVASALQHADFLTKPPVYKGPFYFHRGFVMNI